MRLKLFLRWNILDSINTLCRITLLNEQHFKQTTDFSSRGIKSTPLIAREGRIATYQYYSGLHRSWKHSDVLIYRGGTAPRGLVAGGGVGSTVLGSIWNRRNGVE